MYKSNNNKITKNIYYVLLITIFIFQSCSKRSDSFERVTGNKLKQIKLGMTIENVISNIGKPIKINASRTLHDGNCKNPRLGLEKKINSTSDIRNIIDSYYKDKKYCCDGNKEDLKEKVITLQYTKPNYLSKKYPMLWIHLDDNYKVNCVYAKEYSGFLDFDGFEIYSLSWEFDLKTKTQKNNVDYFIDNEKFNEYFN